EQRLAGIGDRLRQADAAARAGATRERIARAEAQLEQTLAELRELAAGLHPRALSELGLAGALAAPAERAPVRVTIDVEPGRRPRRVPSVDLAPRLASPDDLVVGVRRRDDVQAQPVACEGEARRDDALAVRGRVKAEADRAGRDRVRPGARRRGARLEPVAAV